MVQSFTDKRFDRFMQRIGVNTTLLRYSDNVPITPNTYVCHLGLIDISEWASSPFMQNEVLNVWEVRVPFQSIIDSLTAATNTTPPIETIEPMTMAGLKDFWYVNTGIDGWKQLRLLNHKERGSHVVLKLAETGVQQITSIA